MRKVKHVSRVRNSIALFLSLLSLINLGHAKSYGNNSDDLIRLIQPEPNSQLWINPGIVSYHLQLDKNFNNGNWGADLEYCFSDAASITAGRFYKSNFDYSSYDEV